MLPDPSIHLIDTDVLEHIRHREDSDHIYSELIKNARHGTLKTVKQVFDELQRFKIPYEKLSPRKKAFVMPLSWQYCPEVQDKLELVKKFADYLWDPTGARNPDPADPWLVAVAAAHGFTLVTNERGDSTKRLPAACRHPKINVKCITGAHYLLGAGIVKEIKPEHVLPSAFFSIPQTGGRVS